MTIAEMHTAVKLGLDKSSALELPSFEPEEIDYWLNNLILKFIETRISDSNIKKESFEETQKRIDDLRTLIKDATITTVTAGTASDKPNSYFYNLSTGASDYLHRIGEEVEISFTDSVTATTVTKRQGVTECTNDMYNRFINNPFSEHRLYLNEAKPLRMFKTTYVELITDGNYTITKYFLRYIRQPATVAYTTLVATRVNCDLPSHTHQTIVDMTVATLLENIESNRYQSFKTETLITE